MMFVPKEIVYKPNEEEAKIQKHVEIFSKCLPVHVTEWETLLQESVKPVTYLTNVTEQKRQIDSATCKYFNNFEEVQKELQFKISCQIEDALNHLKRIIDALSKSAFDLKTKLLTLERFTLGLDWEQESLLIRGFGTQPSLARLLQDGLEFVLFFSKNARNISDTFKSLRFDDNEAKLLEPLQEALKVDLKCKIVVNLIALTRYVDNEKDLI